MNSTKLSFLIFVHNEAKELSHLLGLLRSWVEKHSDTEIVIVDDFSTDLETTIILNKLKAENSRQIIVQQHALNSDFATHKNYGTKLCSGSFIFQIDADEYPTEALLENILQLLEMNPTIDLYRVARVNIVRGLTDEDAKKWHWRVYSLPQFPGLPIVNWENDHQGRIYRNSLYMQWVGAVHERIVGHKVETILPCDPDFALIHDKDIARQRKQNEFYSTIRR